MNNYIVITPVRDEEAYLPMTFESMIHQTLKPKQWIIVNDGSTDTTAELIDEYADQHQWITSVHRDDRGYRQPGGGVVETFLYGYKKIRSNDWDFIVKLDGDLEFDNDYFEHCLDRLQQDKTLGIVGGNIISLSNNNYSEEKNPAFHVRGATKIYRRECWDMIQGLYPDIGWDTLDEIGAQFFGWKTSTFSDITIRQMRLTGEKNGMFRNNFKNGLGCYICGYHPIFMFLKCLSRIKRKPILVDSIGQMAGFLYGYFTSHKRYPKKFIIKFIRREQVKRLFGKTTVWK